MSGPKSVSYAVDHAAIARERERARRAAEQARLEAARSAVAARATALQRRAEEERARHGEAVSRPRALENVASMSLEDVERAGRELEAAEAQLRAEAAAARRDALMSALDGVVAAEATELSDRALERARARQAAAPSRDTPVADVRDAVERNCARLSADASPAAADEITTLAQEALAADARHASVIVDQIRARIQAENERVARAAAGLAAVAGLRERLIGLNGPAAEAARTGLEAAINAGRGADERLRGLVDAAVAEADTLAARRVALESIAEALDDLGYDVSEGFDTAVVQDGFADVRRSDWPGYAVRVRLRDGHAGLGFNVVRSSDVRETRRRDAEVETVWCRDLSDVRSKIADAGVHTQLTQETPAGAQPVQIVRDLTTAPPARRRQHLRDMSR